MSMHDFLKTVQLIGESKQEPVLQDMSEEEFTTLANTLEEGVELKHVSRTEGENGAVYHKLTYGKDNIEVAITDVSNKKTFQVFYSNAAARAYNRGYAQPKTFNSIPEIESSYKRLAGIGKLIGESVQIIVQNNLNEAEEVQFKDLDKATVDYVDDIEHKFSVKPSQAHYGIHGIIINFTSKGQGSRRLEPSDLKAIMTDNLRWVEFDGYNITVGIKGKLVKESVELDEIKLVNSPKSEREKAILQLGNALDLLDKDSAEAKELSAFIQKLYDKHVADSNEKLHGVPGGVIGGTGKTQQLAANIKVAKTTDTGNPIEVGDIFNDYLSYTMTLNNFYQVTNVKGKKITMKEIEKKWVGGDVGFTGEVIPLPNKFTSRNNTSTEMTVTVRGNYTKKEDVSFRKGRSGRIYYMKPEADGSYKPTYENHMD